MYFKELLSINNKKEINWNERKIHALMYDIQISCGFDDYIFDCSFISPWSDELEKEISSLKIADIIQVNSQSLRKAKIDLQYLQSSVMPNKNLSDIDKKAFAIFEKSFINQENQNVSEIQK